MGRYKLYCPACKMKFDDNFTNFCVRCEKSGPLLKVVYEDKQLKSLNIPSFWKFLPWLPYHKLNNKFETETIVYKSTGLAHELGLKNLYIAFNGYFPEKNAKMLTCTFKELEAPPTFQRAKEKSIDSLVIASAGNTAKAFMYAAKYYDIALYVVVPYIYRNLLALPFQVPDNVIVIAINNGSDYSDSISFASRITEELGIVNEGGVRNVARRDGMGTVMLEAVSHMTRLPDHYFQAIGSGTGAIAVFEASERVIIDGRFPGKLPELHLSQNQPFTPVVNAWSSGSNELIFTNETEQRSAISSVYAKVLTNRNPPYSVGGGVYDILKKSNGTMYAIDNNEAHSAGKLYETTEGVDLVPASCVVVASLLKALENKAIDPEDVILLNITGGGEKRLWEDFEKIIVEPDLICKNDINTEELKEVIEEVFGHGDNR